MPNQYLLSIDQGTTSSRAILFDLNGKKLMIARKELKRSFPQAGYVEQDPIEIIDSVLYVVKRILEEINAGDVVSCGITNQRETVILWDKESGKPVYNAIVWQDRRTNQWIKSCRVKYGALIQKKTGLVFDAYFSASKIKWILENVPWTQRLLQRKKLLCGTVDSFILWHLTKGKIHATDSSNASRTLLYNIYNKDYDDELLQIFNVPREILAQVKNSIDDFGVIDKSIFNQEIPIRAILGDQQAATVGQACLKDSMGKITFGTGCFMMLNTGDKIVQSQSDLLATILYSVNNKITYGLEGACFYAGAVINWLRDNLNIITNISEVENLVKSAQEIKGLYFVPAFDGLGAPYWNPEAKGLIKGITNQVGKREIIKAAFDSIALQALDLICAMEKDGKVFTTIRVDGGMANNNWFMERLATILRKPIDIPENIESTALGVALFAACGVGKLNFSDIEKLYSMKTQKLAEKLSEYDQFVNGWRQAVRSC